MIFLIIVLSIISYILIAIAIYVYWPSYISYGSTRDVVLETLALFWPILLPMRALTMFRKNIFSILFKIKLKRNERIRNEKIELCLEIEYRINNFGDPKLDPKWLKKQYKKSGIPTIKEWLLCSSIHFKDNSKHGYERLTQLSQELEEIFNK